MALHRDIYWVGRQWAVTGYGLQAVDQKQKGKFDIEASRLWEDGLLESPRVARKRFPEPPRKAASPQEKAASLDNIAPHLKETTSKESPKQPPKPVIPGFDMRIENWPAKFVRQWRIRIRR